VTVASKRYRHPQLGDRHSFVMTLSSSPSMKCELQDRSVSLAGIRMTGKMLSAEPTIDPAASLHDSRLVTRDVPDYTIVAGNPARIIRRRFPEDVSGRLAALAWWDWDHETLRRALPDFRKLAVEDFLAKYEAGTASGDSQQRRAVS
jgi:hypothetical protein